MADEQIDDLDLETEEAPEGGTPTKAPDPLEQEAMKWKRRAVRAEKALKEREVSSFLSEYPQFDAAELEGQDLSKLRALLGKAKPEAPVTTEQVATNPEIEDHKRFVATRVSTEQAPETFTAGELHQKLQRGEITDVQMREFIASGRMKT